MTNSEFDYYFRIATGLNFYTYDWIIENTPVSYEEKIHYFVKLKNFITLLYTIYYNGELKKYGRFDYFKYDSSKNVTCGDFTQIGESSDLVDKLIEIIFGNSKEPTIQYLLTDSGEYILTDSGEKIIL